MRPLAVPQFRRLRRRKSHYDRVKRMGIRLSAIKIGYLTRHSQVSSSAESLTREPQQMTAPGAERKRVSWPTDFRSQPIPLKKSGLK